MWDRMMEYMTEKNRVYRFTDWGFSRGWRVCVLLYWQQWEVDLKEFHFFKMIIL